MSAKKRRRDRLAELLSPRLAELLPPRLVASARRLVDLAGRAIAKVLPTRMQGWPQESFPVGAAKPVEALPDPATRQSLAALTGSADYSDRVRAARVLGGAPEPETTAALTRALRDASSEVAVQAAQSLALHGGPVAIDALREALQNADGYASAETRAAAASALGTILPVDEGTPLAAAVADADATVSLAAIAALAQRDESASAQALMKVLEDRGAFYLPLTRHAAARALSRLNRFDGPRVQALLEHESDPEVRQALEPLAGR